MFRISISSAILGLTIVITGSGGPAQAGDPDPDDLLEAQLIALELSGDLLPPTDLTQLILGDLAAIRDTNPQVADIRYRSITTPDQIIVGLTDQAMADFRNGLYHELDSLNTLYGVVDIQDFNLSPVIVLTFDQIYNTSALADIYVQSNPDGLRYAEPNLIFGDGNTISASPPSYTFTRAWGDCPSGCINHEDWIFQVVSGEAVMVPEPLTLTLLLTGSCAILARWAHPHQ